MKNHVAAPTNMAAAPIAPLPRNDGAAPVYSTGGSRVGAVPLNPAEGRPPVTKPVWVPVPVGGADPSVG